MRGRKNEAHTPTLTGCGDRSHLLREDVDLHTYIKDIANFLYFENLNNLILLSHGYSGMIASAVIQAMPHVTREGHLSGCRNSGAREILSAFGRTRVWLRSR